MQFPRRPPSDTRCNSIVEENVSPSFRLLSRMLLPQFQISWRSGPPSSLDGEKKKGRKEKGVGAVRVECKLIRREIKSSEIPKCVEVSNSLLIRVKHHSKS